MEHPPPLKANPMSQQCSDHTHSLLLSVIVVTSVRGKNDVGYQGLFIFDSGIYDFDFFLNDTLNHYW